MLALSRQVQHLRASCRSADFGGLLFQGVTCLALLAAACLLRLDWQEPSIVHPLQREEDGSEPIRLLLDRQLQLTQKLH